MKILSAFLLVTSLLCIDHKEPKGFITHSFSVDSLGACQGISIQGNRVFLYGDREIGMIREFRVMGDSLERVGKELKLTLNDTDVINHPTGLADHDDMPVFIGNSIRLNKEGTLWRAVIYHVNWDGLQKTGTLDGNLLNIIEDDACIQGTRPEYVPYRNKWYVATADYGNKGNEVRLYDPELLRRARSTKEKGVLYKKFTCPAWVQNLHWIPGKNKLVLIQNQIEGKRWRLSFVDLASSIEKGTAQITGVVETDRADELEGFAFINAENGFAVTSSRKNNVSKMRLTDY
ncbi:hypothetical protein [Parasegetibacter sp. NRK P23]|uniref:hypothetical protein n=1 Tax=Parasegetibacter sp. NRK P23 TaxID=2942999 RepID=UPI002042BE8A|nr:hypothetical protein [Parasegetibacter sp. NRK P23]MCM5529062.1 hypothetical protein [Parasegetibacter sp. NRK P23]